MKKGLIALGLLGLLGTFGVGCGDVCDDAADLCAEETGVSASSENELDCTAATQCTAQCIVDAESCDLTDGALTSCIAKCDP